VSPSFWTLHRVVLPAFVLAITVAVASAQAPDNPSAEQRRAFSSLTAPGNLTLGALPGTDVTKASDSVAEVILEGTESQGVATAVVGWKRGSSQYRLKFTGPIQKATKQATLLMLEDGLPAGATAEFSLSNLYWAHATDAELAEFEQLCLEALKRTSCDIGDLPVSMRREARRLLRMDAMPLYMALTATGTRQTFDFRKTSPHPVWPSALK
jgi:hypothetical protein